MSVDRTATWKYQHRIDTQMVEWLGMHRWFALTADMTDDERMEYALRLQCTLSYQIWCLAGALGRLLGAFINQLMDVWDFIREGVHRWRR